MASASDYLQERMRVLFEIEKTISDSFGNILSKLFKESIIQIPGLEPISGSTAQGGSLAKWFHPDPSKHELEVDFQQYAFRLLAEDQHLIEPIPGKPDNIKIKVNKAIIDERASWTDVSDFYKGRKDGEYADPRVARLAMKERGEFIDYNDTVNTIVSILYGMPHHEIETEVKENLQSTASTMTLIARDKTRRTIVQFSYDNVPSIVCQFWPTPAMSFLTRPPRGCTDGKPVWPTVDERQRIVGDGCDIVPKSSPDGDDTVEYRWSFARLETTVMNLMSDAQKMTYNLAKIIFYKDVKPIQSDAIHSYWAKTVMFWMCEQYPPKHHIWHTESLVNSARKFFQELLAMIKEWNIPHFFIQEHSLLRYVNRELQPLLIDKINKIITEIEKYVPTESEFESAIRRLLPQRDAALKANQFADVLHPFVQLTIRGILIRHDPSQPFHLMTPQEVDNVKFMFLMFTQMSKLG